MRFCAALSFAALLSQACTTSDPRVTKQANFPSTSSTRKTDISTQPGLGLLPTEKNVLPITPDTLCAGIRAALSTAKQNLKAEADAICNDKTANVTFLEALANVYQGQPNPEVLSLNVDNPGNGNVANFVVYATRIKKKPVDTILAEEGIVKQTKYKNPQNGFELALGFDNANAAVNEGDADTAFRVVQQTFADENINGQVGFLDTSYHDLKLYVLYPNNFDFLMAGRTLVKPTEQIKHAGVLRAVMPDATDPNYSISISVINFLMNSRGFPQQVGAAFNTFIASDLVSTYQYHIQNP